MRPLVFLLFFLSFFFSCLFPPLLYYLCNSLEHQVFFVMAFGFQHFGYLVKEHHLTKVLFGRSYMRRCICFHFASLFYGLLHLPTEHNPSNMNACLKDHLFSSSNKNECFFSTRGIQRVARKLQFFKDLFSSITMRGLANQSRITF